jgi:hypothetical protein
MHILKIDFSKCQDCDTCETMLHGFRRRNGGIQLITGRVRDEELLMAAERVKAACQSEAIVLTYYPD